MSVIEPEPPSAFAEPWQARAFACAIHLSRKGLFTWGEWVQAFSAQIASQPARAGEAAEAAYHRQWLATLERLVRLKASVAEAEIDERVNLWRRAYLNTPHGHAVELHHAWNPPSAPPEELYGQDRAPSPIAASPGPPRAGGGSSR